MVTKAASTNPFRVADFRISIFSLLLSTLAINILSLALPVMTLQIYDRVIPNLGSGTLLVLLTGVGIAIVLEAILRLARAYILGWAGAAYEHRLSCAALDHALNVDLAQLNKFGIAEHLNRMAAIGKLKDFYSGAALTTLMELIFVPVFLGVIIYIAGPLALVPTTILSAFTIFSLIEGHRLRTALKARDVTDDRRYDFLIEGLEGIHTIKAFALENQFARRYEHLETESTLANLRVTDAMAGTFNAGATFSHLMVASTTAGGALLALDGRLTTGALVATVLLSGRMLQPIQKALALWTKYQDFRLARAKVAALFAIPRQATPAANSNLPARSGSIVLHDVSLKAAGSQGLNLSLRPGESILLQAEREEAKTAWLEMLAGMMPPDAGQILIDGRDITEYAPANLIQHVGYIPAEGLIFRGTVRDNMTGFGQIPERQAQDLSSLLRINRDIARLPSGFDTFMHGNTTDSLPPGLKQKISMVRVLSPRPRIILFDNADRALDREGYAVIYDLLARIKGTATLIINSEDRNIRALANRILTIENGELADIPMRREREVRV